MSNNFLIKNTPILKEYDTIGIISTSDGVSKETLSKIINILENFNLKPKLSQTIIRVNSHFSGTGEERAEELTKLFCDKEIKAIFDISGGDSANYILPYLDFEKIAQNKKYFFGYSDLSVIINFLYRKSHVKSFYYNFHNLYGEFASEQQDLFKKLFFNENPNFLTYDLNWIYGKSMSGIVIGGNIRCFLKLAGTKYFPNVGKKILFLESLSGNSNRIGSFLAQLEQIGVFEKISGILLGTFTELENKKDIPTTEELFLEIANYQLQKQTNSVTEKTHTAYQLGLRLIFE